MQGSTRKLFLICLVLVLGVTWYNFKFHPEFISVSAWVSTTTDTTRTRNVTSSVARNDSHLVGDVKTVVTGTISDAPLKPCPEKPPIKETNVALNLTEVTYEDLKRDLGHVVQAGGHYSPSTCKSRERIALIIPYRDRQRNLFILLHNLIPFLICQQAEFSIFVVEQTPDFMFNKGVLIDLGFVKAKQDGDYTCFIVHDTDLIPRDYRNLYRCADRPRHLMLIRSGEQRKVPEKLPYPSFLGGAVALRRDHFEKSNGWSTAYYGWGFEDDDMEIRLRSHGFRITRYPIEIGTYYELGHTPQKPGPRQKLSSTVRKRMNTEGLNTLNTLNYTLVKEEKLELYHWYLVKSPAPPQDVYGNSTR